MKVIFFTIPTAKDHSIHVQEDELPHFYEHLHRHDEIQITLIHKGSGTLITGNMMQQFQPGDVFILGSNQPHLFKSDPGCCNATSKENIHTLNIFFNPNGFLNSLLDFPEMKTVRKFVDSTLHSMKASESNQKLISDYICKVRNSTMAYRLSAFIESLQLMANLNDWQYLSTESFEHAVSDTEAFRMNDIYQFTLAHYAENITLDQVAEVVYLTPPSFCRYFKKHTLKTYTEFLNDVRINEACKIFMGNSFQSISTVAYQTGFNNSVTFNRVFKAVKGKSPREFIKQYHKSMVLINE